MGVKSVSGLLYSSRGSTLQNLMNRPGNWSHASNTSSLDCCEMERLRRGQRQRDHAVNAAAVLNLHQLGRRRDRLAVAVQQTAAQDDVRVDVGHFHVQAPSHPGIL